MVKSLLKRVFFIQLAKLHHPDLNVHRSGDDHNAMTELVTAYETLMNKHGDNFSTDARDSRVALACEMYTIEELKNSDAFDVYSFRITFETSDEPPRDVMKGGVNPEDATADIRMTNGAMEEPQCNQLDPTPIVPLITHPDDSILDLKRHIQSEHATSWGLVTERVDRNGMHLGWELVYCNSEMDSSASSDEGDVNVLSYHLFLQSYGITDGDILHAVVRRRK